MNFRDQFETDRLPSAVSGSLPSECSLPGHFEGVVARRLRVLFKTPLATLLVRDLAAARAVAVKVLLPGFGAIFRHVPPGVEAAEVDAGFPAHLSRFDLEGSNGKLTVDGLVGTKRIPPSLREPGLRLLVISQPTEAGTWYTPEEIIELTFVARQVGLRVLLDGSLLLGSLGASDAGLAIERANCLDALILDGAVHGLAPGAALLLPDSPELGLLHRVERARHFADPAPLPVLVGWRRLLDSDAWRATGITARSIADQLARWFAILPGVHLHHPVETHRIYLRLPVHLAGALLDRGWRIPLKREGDRTIARLACSAATTHDAAEALLRDLTQLALSSSESDVAFQSA